MKRLRKILCVLVVGILLLCGINVSALAEGEEVVILYTNDVHTYIDKEITYSRLASIKKSFENALLVDAGDHIQGTAFGAMDKGATITKLMSETGYDLATLGNHEFDYGMSGCLATIDRAEYPYVSCNFYHEKDGVVGDTVLEPYKVFEMAGIKIAFIGITTPETFTKSTPTYFQNDKGEYIYGIAGGTDGKALYDTVQKAIDSASAEADFVIALGHLGIDLSSCPWTSEEVIANTEGLDAFIDGHSHHIVPSKEVLDKNGDKVVLTQTGQYFSNLGKMTISKDGIKTELLSLDDVKDVPEDEAVKTIEDQWKDEINQQLGAVIGKSEVVFDNYDENGKRLVRSQSTNSGDFSADALYYLFDNMGIDVDVAVMNGGGIRNVALTGDLTYFSCKEIHTFGNVACILSVTGRQLLDALEWGAKDLGLAESGSLLHPSGLTYKINTSIENTTQCDDKGVWTGGPTGEYRVYDVKIYNKENGKWEDIDLDKKYNLAGYNYTLRDLGGGFAMFEGAENILDYVMEDYMVLANYVEGFENKTILATNSPLAKKYENFTTDYGTVYGSGRITVGEKEIPKPADNSDRYVFFVILGVLAVASAFSLKKSSSR